MKKLKKKQKSRYKDWKIYSCLLAKFYNIKGKKLDFNLIQTIITIKNIR